MKGNTVSRLLVLASVVWLASCGGSSPSPSPAPAPPPGPPPPPPATYTWDQAKAAIVGNCQKCHDGVKEPLLIPEAVFRASSAKAKLAAGAMPPAPNLISAADKQVLVGFLNQ